VARPGKAKQTAFDELDRPCAASEIKTKFMPHVREALEALPDASFGSVERAAVALAESQGGEIPAGHGAALVHHFCRRHKLLEDFKVPVEYKFALIELALLAGIANRWIDSSLTLTTSASYQRCIRQAVQLPESPHIEREQLRSVLAVALDSEDSTVKVFRSIASALVWCGYFSADRSMMTDEDIAQLFSEDRPSFIKFRQEALRWLPKLLKCLCLPPVGRTS